MHTSTGFFFREVARKSYDVPCSAQRMGYRTGGREREAFSALIPAIYAISFRAVDKACMFAHRVGVSLWRVWVRMDKQYLEMTSEVFVDRSFQGN
jgi:hypothetical protein